MVTTSSQATSDSTIIASKMPLLSPSALLQAHLSQSPQTRPSNRSPLQTRPIHLNTSSLTHCNGSAVVRIGEATIVCGIRAEILPVSEIPHFRASDAARTATTKETDTETDSGEETYEAVRLNNLLVPNLELSTGVHPLYPAQTAPSVTAQTLSQRLLRSLHTSRLVRTIDLEIRYNPPPVSEQGLDPDDPAYIELVQNELKAYWVLYIDCVCLGYGGEGATFDAAWLAVYAALKDTLLPRAWWDADDRLILCSADMGQARNLRLRGTPVPLSFGVFTSDPRLRMNASSPQHGQQADNTPVDRSQAQSTLLLDLDMFEDGVCEEKGCVMIDVSTDRHTRLLGIEKAGGAGVLGVQGIRQVVSLAEKRHEEWRTVLQKDRG